MKKDILEKYTVVVDSAEELNKIQKFFDFKLSNHGFDNHHTYPSILYTRFNGVIFFESVSDDMLHIHYRIISTKLMLNIEKHPNYLI